MLKLRSLVLIVAVVILFSGGAVRAEDQDYGYWCTTCGRQHGPGESCPNASAPASTSQDEPYDWSQPVYTPTSTTTTIRSFVQAAREYNEEGEELYRQGKYQEAYNKFWAAQFSDFDTPLYKENLNKAKYALEREEAEKKKQQEEIKSRGAVASKKIKNIQPFGSSVVDLREKKGPLVVDPNGVKRPVAKPRSLKITPPPAPGSLSDKEMWDLIAELQGGKTLSKTGQKRIFEKNPDKYLTNPLLTKEKLAQDTMRAMDNDKEYVAARKRHVAEADQSIFEASLRLLEMAGSDLNELRKKSGSKNLTELRLQCESDPVLRQKTRVINADYRDELHTVTIKYNERLGKQMAEEKKRFYQRHPELKN